MKNNDHGKIYYLQSHSTKDKTFTPLQEINSNFDLLKSIELGSGRAIGITSNDELLEWKNDKKTPHQKKSEFPFLLSKPVYHFHKIKFAKVLLNKTMCLALDTFGNVLSWGDNQDGLLGFGYTITSINTPTHLETLREITEIALSDNHAISINLAGEAFSWGTGKYGELGLEKSIYTPTPLRMNGTRLYSKVIVSNLISCFLDTHGHFSYYGVIIKILKGSYSTITVKNLLNDQSNSDPSTLFQEKIIYELENEPFISVSIGNGFIALLSKKGMIYTLEYSDKLTALYSKYFVYSLTVANNHIYGLSFDNKQYNNSYNNNSLYSHNHSQIMTHNQQQQSYLCQWISKASDKEVSSEIWTTTIFKVIEDLHLDNIVLINSNNRNLILLMERGMNLNNSVLFPNPNKSTVNISNDISWDNITYNEPAVGCNGLLKKHNMSSNFLSFESEFDDSYNMKFKRSKSSNQKRSTSPLLNLTRTMMSDTKNLTHILPSNQNNKSCLSSVPVTPFSDRQNKRLLSSNSTNHYNFTNNEDESVETKEKELKNYQKEIEGIISNFKLKQKEKTVNLKKKCLRSRGHSTDLNISLRSTDSKRKNSDIIINTTPNNTTQKFDTNKTKYMSIEKGIDPIENKSNTFQHLDTSNNNINIETKNNFSDIERMLDKTNNDNNSNNNTDNRNDVYSDIDEVNLFNKSNFNCNIFDESSNLKLSSNFVYTNNNKSNFLSPQFSKSNKISKLYVSKDGCSPSLKTVNANSNIVDANDSCKVIRTNLDEEILNKITIEKKEDKDTIPTGKKKGKNTPEKELLDKHKNLHNEMTKNDCKTDDLTSNKNNTQNNLIQLTRNKTPSMIYQRSYSSSGLHTIKSLMNNDIKNNQSDENNNLRYKQWQDYQYNKKIEGKTRNDVQQPDEGRVKCMSFNGFTEKDDNRPFTDRVHLVPFRKNFFNRDNMLNDNNDNDGDCQVKNKKYNIQSSIKRMDDSNKMSTIVHLENSSNFTYSNDNIFEETPKFDTKIMLNQISTNQHGVTNLINRTKISNDNDSLRLGKSESESLRNDKLEKDQIKGKKQMYQKDKNTSKKVPSLLNDLEINQETKYTNGKAVNHMSNYSNDEEDEETELFEAKAKLKAQKKRARKTKLVKRTEGIEEEEENEKSKSKSRSIQKKKKEYLSDEEKINNNNIDNDADNDESEEASKPTKLGKSRSKRQLNEMNIINSKKHDLIENKSNKNSQHSSMKCSIIQEDTTSNCFKTPTKDDNSNLNQLYEQDSGLLFSFDPTATKQLMLNNKQLANVINQQTQQQQQKSIINEPQVEQSELYQIKNDSNEGNNINERIKEDNNNNNEEYKESNNYMKKKSLVQSVEDLRMNLKLDKIDNINRKYNNNTLEVPLINKQTMLKQKNHNDIDDNKEETLINHQASLKMNRDNIIHNKNYQGESDHNNHKEEKASETSSIVNKENNDSQNNLQKSGEFYTNKESSQTQLTAVTHKESLHSQNQLLNENILHTQSKHNLLIKDKELSKSQSESNEYEDKIANLNFPLQIINLPKNSIPFKQLSLNQFIETRSEQPLTNIFNYSTSIYHKENQNDITYSQSNNNDTARLGGRDDEDYDDKRSSRLSKDNFNNISSNIQNTPSQEDTNKNRFTLQTTTKEYINQRDYLISTIKDKIKSEENHEEDDSTKLFNNKTNTSNSNPKTRLDFDINQKDYYTSIETTNKKDEEVISKLLSPSQAKNYFSEQKTVNESKMLSPQTTSSNIPFPDKKYPTTKRKRSEIITENMYSDDIDKMKIKKYSNPSSHENSSTETQRDNIFYKRQFGQKFHEYLPNDPHYRISSMPVVKGMVINPEDTFGINDSGTIDRERDSKKNNSKIMSSPLKDETAGEGVMSSFKPKIPLMIKIPNDDSVMNLPQKGIQQSNEEEEENSIRRNKNNENDLNDLTEQKIFTLKGYSHDYDSSLQVNGSNIINTNNNDVPHHNIAITPYINNNQSIDNFNESATKPSERIIKLISQIKSSQNQIENSMTSNQTLIKQHSSTNNFNENQIETQSSHSNKNSTTPDNIYTFSNTLTNTNANLPVNPTNNQSGKIIGNNNGTVVSNNNSKINENLTHSLNPNDILSDHNTSSAISNTQSYNQSNSQSNTQSNAQSITQSNAHSFIQSKAQSKPQSNLQSTVQSNVQSNAHTNANTINKNHKINSSITNTKLKSNNASSSSSSTVIKNDNRLTKKIEGQSFQQKTKTSKQITNDPKDINDVHLKAANSKTIHQNKKGNHNNSTSNKDLNDTNSHIQQSNVSLRKDELKISTEPNVSSRSTTMKKKALQNTLIYPIKGNEENVCGNINQHQSIMNQLKNTIETPSSNRGDRNNILVSLVSETKHLDDEDTEDNVLYIPVQQKNKHGEITKILINKNMLNYFGFLVTDVMKKKAAKECIGKICLYLLHKEKTYGSKILFRLIKKRLIFYEIKFFHRLNKIHKYMINHQ